MAIRSLMPHLHLVGGADSSCGSTAADSVVERFELVVRTRTNLGQIELPRNDCTLGSKIDCNGMKLLVIEHVGPGHPGELPILVVELA